MRTVQVVRADPAGNITALVLSDVPKEERPALVAKLMALPDWGVEQVGFVRHGPPGIHGVLEMMGGEFCGNAARAYGMLLARQSLLIGRQELLLRVSGCRSLVQVVADTYVGTASAAMPLPRKMIDVTVGDTPATLVDLDGIAHLVVHDVAPSRDFFAAAEPIFQSYRALDAYGVCFVKGDTLTPLVKVVNTDTLVFEGSCGSGAMAAAFAASRGEGDGKFTYRLRQPKGTVEATVVRDSGMWIDASIGGPVTVGDVTEITL